MSSGWCASNVLWTALITAIWAFTGYQLCLWRWGHTLRTVRELRRLPAHDVRAVASRSWADPGSTTDEREAALTLYAAYVTLTDAPKPLPKVLRWLERWVS